MTQTGVLQSPQTIPDAAQPVQGIPGSRGFFFLRSTPKVFTLLAAGQSNQDFQIAAVQAVDVAQVELPSRVAVTPFSSPPFLPPAAVTLPLALGSTTTGTLSSVRAQVATALTFGSTTRATSYATVAQGFYASLIADDRPLAWWGFDDTPTEDETGHGYDLTAVGSPALASTLLVRGNEQNAASVNLDGASAYTVDGTLYQAPTSPPPYHSATYAGGSDDELELVTPAGVQAGDLVLFFLTHSSQTATISTAPADVTQVGTTLNAGTCAVALYKYSPGADEPQSGRTWTWSTSGTVLGVCLVYRGCDPDVSGLVYDSGQQATSSDSFHSTTSETYPVQARTLALWAGEFSGTLTPEPTNLRLRADVSAGNLKIVAADYERESAGSAACTATTSTNTTLGAFLVTFGSDDEVVEDVLDALAEKVSIHALVNADSLSGTRTIIRKHGSWGLQTSGTTLQFLYTDGGGTDRTVSGPTLSTSATYMLVVADDDSDIHFWVDGVHSSASRTGDSGYTTTANAVVIGAHDDGGYASYWDGRIDELAVFGAALSDQMVQTYQTALSDGTFGQKLLGDEILERDLYPRLKLEVAWASAPSDDTLVWEDVTADVRAAEGLNPTRGRNFELDRIEAGRFDFTLSNRDRAYDPEYAASPYYPNVAPTRAVRLRVQTMDDGLVYPIFFGYTEGHPQTRSSMDATARFTAIDPFKALQLDKVLGTFIRPQELTGARLQALLDGSPGIPYTGDDGRSEVVGDDLNGVNSLDHAQQVAETDGGIVFCDARGTVTFHDRHHRTLYGAAPVAAFGTTYPITHMEPQTDEARLFTSATVSPASGNVQSSIDVGNALQHFLRTKQLTTLHTSDADALAMAHAYANRYAVPRTRIPSIVLTPAGASDPAAMWAAVLALEIGDRIQTVEYPLEGSDFSSTPVTRDHFIEGISHQVRGGQWVVSLSVSPAELEGDYFLIGTSQIGDSDTVIGW